MGSLSSLTKQEALRLGSISALLVVALLFMGAVSVEGTQTANRAIQATFPPPYYYYVTTGEDEPPDIPISNCGSSTGTCTLRAAVTEASGDLNNISKIFLSSGFYTLTYGSLTPEQQMELIGAGAEGTIIHVPNGVFNILSVAANANLTLYDVTLTGGIASTGGAIENFGDITLIRSVVRENDAVVGGGIWSSGTLTLVDSEVIQNTGLEGDGGIFNMGTATLIQSTVSNNFGGASAGGISNEGTLEVISSTINHNQGADGGGLKNWSELVVKASTVAFNESFGNGGGLYSGGGLVQWINSTLSGNTAENGGGIYNHEESTIWMTSATVANNSAEFDGGGILMEAGAGLNLRNSILSANTAGGVGGNCRGILGPVSHLLVSSDDCNLTGTFIVADPLLGDLQNNGGPTATHALPEDSLAIDGVPVADCTDFSGSPLLTDQRGLPRPSAGRCDIGAFELSFQQLLPMILR